ncbi:hypothetical protein [Clostridium scatologenes]|uniref:Uncharacterized protein n=1 Tax=Clostridium scatologenes TaxID=1548 RepID=A0A0E3M7Z2_CLOSL|nr:hypothetical protein [Clostridium scatologenes]AKA71222.1 hypothetical protein CSCA_4097 [Clostridium scatologenes]
MGFMSEKVKRNITFVKVSNRFVRRDKDDKYERTYIKSCGEMAAVLSYILTKRIDIEGKILINLNMILENELGWSKKKIENNIKEVRETLNYMVQQGIFAFEKELDEHNVSDPNNLGDQKTQEDLAKEAEPNNSVAPQTQEQLDFNKIKPTENFLITKHNFLEITAEKYKQGVYFQVEFEIVEKLKNVAKENKIDFCKLFNLYYTIVSRFCNNNNIAPHSGTGTSFPSYIQIEEDTGLTETTIKKYEKILSDNNLIKYINVGGRKCPDGSYKESPNIYTTGDEYWEDRLKEQAKYFKKTQSEKYGVIFIGNKQEKTTNEKRSISAKINYLEAKKKTEKLNKKEQNELNKLKKQKEEIEEKKNREYAPLTDENCKKINDNSLKTLNPQQSLTKSYEDIEKGNYSYTAYEEELEKGVIDEDGNLLKDSYLDDIDE